MVGGASVDGQGGERNTARGESRGSGSVGEGFSAGAFGCVGGGQGFDERRGGWGGRGRSWGEEGVGSDGGDLAEGAELAVAVFEEVFELAAFEVADGFDEVLFEVMGGFVVVAVGAAEWFGDDGVGGAEFEEVRGGEFESGGGLGGLVAGFPEDGGAAFGADDGVVGELEESEAVADADAECAAGAALADDDADDGGAEARHFHEIEGDGLGLASFLGADAGIGARGVDEADDGEVEFFGEFHFGQGLAVAFGVGHAEIAGDAFLGGAAFVVGDEHDLFAAEAGKAGDDGAVVAEGAVAVEFAEVLGDEVEVVGEERAAGVAGDLDGLPGGEVVVDFGGELDEVLAELADFGGVVDAAGALEVLEFGDLGFEFGNGFFEVEPVGWGGGGFGRRAGL